MHGELADRGHHLARDVLDPRLEEIHLLRQLHGALPAVDGLHPQLVGQGRHLFKDELLLQEALLLVVQPLLQVRDLDLQRPGVQVLAAQLSPLPQGALRVLELARELVRLPAHGGDLLAKLNHLRHEPGHPRDLVPRDEELPLDLQEVYLQAADLLGARAHGVLSPLHQLLLDVGLLPEDAELVVPVDELRAREVPGLHGLLVLPAQDHHLLLDGAGDGVELVDLNDVLLHLLVERGALGGDPALVVLQLVVDDAQLLLLALGALQLLVLEGALHAEDFDLVLEDLELLLHLREVLGGLLDLRHVLVPLGLHDLVHGAELLLLLADLVVLLLEVCLLELLHGHLLGRLLALSVRHGGFAGQLLALRGERLVVGRPLLLVHLEDLELLLHLLYLRVDHVELLFLVLLERLLLQIGADEEVDLRLDVVQELLLPHELLLLRLRVLLRVRLLLDDRLDRVVDSLLVVLRPLEHLLGPVELLLERRQLGVVCPALGAELVQLLVQRHALQIQLDVDVLLPVQPLLHVLGGLVRELGALRHQLEAHLLFRPLILLLLPGSGGLQMLLLHNLDLLVLLLLALHERLHSLVELLGLLADAGRLRPYLRVLALVGFVDRLVELDLLLQLRDPGIVLLQTLLQLLLLLLHQLSVLLEHLDVLLRPVDLRLRHRLGLLVPLLELSLLLRLVVLELRLANLQHHLPVLNHVVLLDDLLLLLRQLGDRLLVLARLQRRLLELDLLRH
mmetsp:Transcript_51831/g.152759  ORF Transcript_51831/g.152759 Transcript_51831/m.152759 type:complete len:735 (-) Transcript_51831:362-2566(-)